MACPLSLSPELKDAREEVVVAGAVLVVQSVPAGVVVLASSARAPEAGCSALWVWCPRASEQSNQKEREREIEYLMENQEQQQVRVLKPV